MYVLNFSYMAAILILLLSTHCWALENGQVKTEIAVVGDWPLSGSYTYSPGDRRDPFQPRVQEIQEVTSQENTPDALRFSRSDWKILGIISGSTGMKAVLRNVKGRRYTVSLGDVLSPNHLRVVRLTNTTVVLESFAGQSKQVQGFIPQTVELILK
ncbi:MAG: pilus assembly protein PilP [Nitrospirales bacterium]